jgi:hypothetical protein
MSPVSQEQFDQIKGEIHAVLGGTVSELFLRRVDALLEDWVGGKYTAAEACDKVQKLVSLFIDKGKSQEIGLRFAPIIKGEAIPPKK